jgi:putative endonuclease
MSFWVYMLASRHYGTLYVGVTRDLSRRVWEHKTKAVKGFTYDVTKLVWYEEYPDPTSAISREKDIKKWRRDWKIRLIEESNPNWLDLYETLNR